MLSYSFVCFVFANEWRQFKLLPTFAGVLREKNSYARYFTKILANYTSEESLITAVYYKNII